ncbi:MAG TPA: AI-2E family transporter, partial [Tepidisphaeraceae bacterium]
MAHKHRVAKPSTLATVTVLVVAVATLYFARDVIIPMVLAVLLAFLLGRPVAWLERRKVGRVSSVLLVVTVAFLVIGGLGYVVGNQVVGLANNLG